MNTKEKPCTGWGPAQGINRESGLMHTTPNTPKNQQQLDRINNNGNYEPGNTRWVTSAENCRNRRPQSEWNTLDNFKGKTKTFGIRIESDLIDRLRLVSEKDQRSISFIARKCIEIGTDLFLKGKLKPNWDYEIEPQQHERTAMKNLTFTLYRELELPAEVELEAVVSITPGSMGYFNPINGDCDPPHGSDVEVQNEDAMIQQLRQWFDLQREEAVKQLRHYLDSEAFAEIAEDEASSYDEAA